MIVLGFSGKHEIRQTHISQWKHFGGNSWVNVMSTGKLDHFTNVYKREYMEKGRLTIPVQTSMHIFPPNRLVNSVQVLWCDQMREAQ